MLLAGLLLLSPGVSGGPVPVVGLWPVPGVVGTAPWSVALAGLVSVEALLVSKSLILLMIANMIVLPTRACLALRVVVIRCTE